MDYYNVVEGFINYALSNLKNITGGGIRCSCKRCKTKVSRSKYCYNASSMRKFHGKILVLICTRRTICSLRDHGRNNGCVNF